MANPVGRVGFKLISLVVGIPVGMATRTMVERAWLAARPGDPPRQPKDPDVTWADAVGWAAVSAAGVAAAELMTMKGASSLWRTLTGFNPPASKAAKKRAKEPAAIDA